jgi:Protein of unknown function (DUF2721)
MQEQWGSDLETVIRVLQTALAPAFLLAAIASLLNVLTGRLAGIVSRSRELQKQLPEIAGETSGAVISELRVVAKRKKLSRIAISLSILGAIVICLMVSLLFVMGLTSFSMASLTITMFAVAMGLIACSLGALSIEVGLASREAEISID